MRQLTFSDDLRRVDVVGLELSAARALRVHLLADRARVVGLAPWSRSPRLSPLGRFATLAALGAALWLAVGVVWRGAVRPDPNWERYRAGARWQRWLASLLLAAPGAVVAGGFISLDQERAAPMAYLGAALLGLFTLGLLRFLARHTPRIFSHFNGF